MKLYYAILLAILMVNSAYAQTLDEQAIMNILHTQSDAWNDGDIETYMKAGYWQNDSLLFIGSRGPTYGFENTLKNYKKGYPTAEKMGQLFFSELQLKPISGDHYFVVGKWMLKRKDGDLSGYFTLLFKKINGTWRIIADHSS